MNPLQHRLLDVLARRPGRPVRRRRPEPGHLRLERRRRRRTSATSRPATAGRVVELLDNYRSTPADPRASPPRCSAADGPDRSPPTGPTGPVPTVVTYPTDTDEALGIARAVRDHHHPTGRRGTARPCSCAPTPRRTVIEEALGRARIPYRLRGAAPFLTRPGVVEALGTLAGTTGGLAVALAELAAETPRGDDLTDRQRETAADTSTRSCSSARSSSPSSPPARSPTCAAGSQRRSGPTTARGRRRRRDRHLPRRQGPRVAGGPRRRAGGRATSRSSHARSAEARPRSAGCCTSRSPGPRRSCAARGRNAASSGRPRWTDGRRRTWTRWSTPTAALRAAVADVDHDQGLARARAHLDRPVANGRPHRAARRAAASGATGWPARPGSRRRSCSPTRRWSRWPSAVRRRSTTSAR